MKKLFMVLLLISLIITISSCTSSTDYKKKVSANLHVEVLNMNDDSAYYGKEQIHYYACIYDLGLTGCAKNFTNEKYPTSKGEVSFSTPMDVMNGQRVKLCIYNIVGEQKCEHISWEEIENKKPEDSGIIIIHKNLKVYK